MDMESPEAAFFAIHALKYAYRNATGYEGRMLQGKAAANEKPVFRSQAELAAAMDDPRYEKDPAYRKDVEQRLENSTLISMAKKGCSSKGGKKVATKSKKKSLAGKAIESLAPK